MKRVVWLWVGIAIIAAGALALRVRSGVERPVLRRAVPLASTSQVADVPRDYVLTPQVDAGEQEAGPRRIVSMAPSITEVVCALGLADRLVGRTPYSDYLPAVASVPPLGAVADANLEKIRSLKPDLVLVTANSTRLAADLGRLGVRCEAIPHETFEQVFDAIVRVGQLCDRPKTAAMLVEAIRGDLARLAAGLEHRPDRHRVLVVLGPLPVPPRTVWVAGPGSFLNDLLRLVGQSNAAADLGVAYGEMPLARLRAVDPEIILELGPSRDVRSWSDLYQSWSALGSLEVFRQQKVRTVGGQEWLSAGPRIAIELHRFLAILAEFDAATETRME